MSDDVTPVSGVNIDKSIESTEQKEAKEILQREARQISSEDNMVKWAENEAPFNPRRQRKNFKTLKEQFQRKATTGRPEKSDTARSEEASESVLAEQIAEDFYKSNPELQKKTLLALRAFINPDDSLEEILEKLQSIYKDQYLADEAIDFLIQTSERKEALKRKLIEVKARFNAHFGREILAGRNIAAQALNFSRKNLGTPTALRDLYRDITGKPRKPYNLFQELTTQFKFSDMKNIIDFILHSLGSDLKAKGSSISRSELQRLFSEARTMQAILGLFRFFHARMRVIKKLFDREDLVMPMQLNFEKLAQLLMELLQERYPSNTKILKLAFTLGISEELAAQIIVFTQYRDAMRHISPKLFFSERHRQEMLMTLMETLSDLEDELEDEEEEDED
ncbi:MAG: HrpJ domain-containing protein [Chlamydiota bacterium]